MTPYQPTAISKWKLAHIKYLSGSCFPSVVAFQVLDKTEPLLPQSKCIVQVKSTSVQRLWYLSFQTGSSDHGEQYGVFLEPRIFKFMGFFFLLTPYWMLPILTLYHAINQVPSDGREFSKSPIKEFQR